jgi:hypothetical protein
VSITNHRKISLHTSGMGVMCLTLPWANLSLFGDQFAELGNATTDRVIE